VRSEALPRRHTCVCGKKKGGLWFSRFCVLCSMCSGGGRGAYPMAREPQQAGPAAAAPPMLRRRPQMPNHLPPPTRKGHGDLWQCLACLKALVLCDVVGQVHGHLRSGSRAARGWHGGLAMLHPCGSNPSKTPPVRSRPRELQ